MTNPMELEHDADTEDYEEIPWSHLVEELGRPRHNLPLLAAGVLVVGALAGYLVARVVVSDPPVPPPDSVTSAPNAGPITAPDPPSHPQPTTTVATMTSPPVPPEVLFSEADLMAVVDDHELTTAAARAEWFVRDFFTVDTSSEPSDQVTEVVAAVEATRPTGPTSYVEWARTSSVEPTGPNTYEVSVVFQMLVAEGDAFVRHAPRAVRVTVTVDDSLASAVSGLPRPAQLGTAQAAVAPIGEDAAAPAHVVEEATLRALRFGTDPTPIRSWFDAGTWHIVMTVQHAGAAWPLLVDVAEPGNQP